MRITNHGDHLYQLTRYWVINCFLVREDDGLTLIDTGLAGSGAAIRQAVADLGLPLARIALTHAHGDHAGSLDELAAAFPEADVLLAPRTADFLAGDLSLHPDEPQAALRGGFVTRAAQPARLLHPGDRVGSLRVEAAPGHSPDQIAFVDERDGSLIAGDAFQTQGGLAVSGVLRWRFPLPAMATWHLPTAVESARRLTALRPSRLAVGHGRVLEDPATAMAAAVREAEGKASAQAQTA